MADTRTVLVAVPGAGEVAVVVAAVVVGVVVAVVDGTAHIAVHTSVADVCAS